jgi:hypothetical protein
MATQEFVGFALGGYIGDLLRSLLPSVESFPASEVAPAATLAVVSHKVSWLEYLRVLDATVDAH